MFAFIQTPRPGVIETSRMDLPSQLPLILLAECNVFPHALLPLNIFEARYRVMLDHALKAERMFGVGTLLDAGNGLEWDEVDDNISAFTTASLVRACVGQPDGSSRLILQGVGRLHITGWLQREPFRIALVEPVPSIITSKAAAASLVADVLAGARNLVGADPALVTQFDNQFGPLRDPEIVADVIGYNFIPNAMDRHPLLGLDSVEERLRFILGFFENLGTPTTRPAGGEI